MRSAALLILVVGGLALTGCVSGRPKSDTYTDKSGAVQAIESDREACEHACNDEYARCGDSGAAHRTIDATQGMFGGSAMCGRSLQTCMSHCKGR